MSQPTGTQHVLALDGQCAVVTELGAGLRSYRVDGRELVSPFAADALPLGMQGQHLMPWPNRVRDGRWRHDGRPQQLPITEPERHNAIHGLTWRRHWATVESSQTHLTQRLLLEPEPGWPGTLELEVRHELSPAGLGVQVRARNVGSSAVPFGYGAHPYLLPPDDVALDELELRVPFATALDCDERLLPLRRRPAPAGLADGRRLQGLRLDTAFTDAACTDATSPDGSWQVVLAGPRHATVLWGGPGLGWLQVYTPDARDAIAVEPMSCGPDAFNPGPTHEGLVQLQPGAQLELCWGLRHVALPQPGVATR